MTPSDLDAELRRLLAARATRVAAPPPEPEEPGGEVVVVEVGLEALAVPVPSVARVGPRVPVTRVPGTAAHWAGVLPGRAGFVAVLDVATVLGLPRADDAPGALVTVAAGGREVVLAVDRAVGMARVRSVDPPVGGLSGLAAELVAGVAPGPLTVLDCERLLTALAPQPSSPSRSDP